VSNSRPVPTEALTVRRRRICANCDISFHTEERPRLWVVRGSERESFLGATLLSSLYRAMEGCDPPVPASRLHEVVRDVVADLLADAELEISSRSIRRRTGEALLTQGLNQLAYRYDPSLDPEAFLILKRGDRGSEPFVRDKLVGGIMAAASKFLSASAVTSVASQIENELGAASGQTDTAEIRRLVGAALRSRDERAFLRYALGGQSSDEDLSEFLEKIAPTAQVRKRDGSIVLFDGSKLGKSIRRSFVADSRDDEAPDIAKFVSEEERRVRHKMATDGTPERTSKIGNRVLVWLFSHDELAWANYWLAFESDRVSGVSPTLQLADARAKMRNIASG
jgi:transcriptional regulator NrdR family protein